MELPQWFLQHLLAIRFTFEDSSKKRQELYISCFPVSLLRRWFLVTAGHCFEEIKDAEEAGLKITGCEIIDNVSIESNYHHGIPYLDYYRKLQPVVIGAKKGIDLAFLPIASSMHIEALQKNKVVQLDERAWKNIPKDPDDYLLFGFPGELVTRDGLFPTCLKVTSQKHFPGEQVDPGVFYGYVDVSDLLDSIKGMSGGPIFAIKHQKDGRVKYWLHSVQRGWDKDTQKIVATYFPEYANALASEMKRVIKNISKKTAKE